MASRFWPVTRPILFALMFGLAACGQTQPQGSFSPTKLSDLHIGKTTYAEIVSEFGPPSSESTLPDGRRITNYQYEEEVETWQGPTMRGGVPTARMVPRAHVFQLQFDSSGILRDYTSMPQ